MKTTALALLVSLLLVAPAAADARPDIVTTAAADGRFSTLASALEKAGLVEALRGKGPFTVFAPTDEAFAALPAGALEGLLRDKGALTQLLGGHVVSGRVLSTDLLKATSAQALSGTALAFGLRVGKANVIQADLLCSNGVIHVIDRVLVPSLAAARKAAARGAPTRSARRTEKRVDPVAAIHAALDRGVPLFNEGHVDACAREYEKAAQELLASTAGLSAWDRQDLAAAMKKPAADARERAWNLRHAFDAIVANATFEPRMEASLPKGFPRPGPVGHVIEKRYPSYRAARAKGGSMAFWTLFRHIKSNKVEMTAPVEMTMDGNLRERDMAFLYERPDQGRAGAQGKVDVLDLNPLKVLSIGLRGRRSAETMTRAKRLLEAHMREHGYERDGDFRALGYNSPMVPAAQQYWEFQVPVRR